MPQNVIEKKLYADMLNQVIFGSKNLYPFSEIMGKVNIPGANYRYDGERSIVLTSIRSGKDVPSSLQSYTANANQQWENIQDTLTIRYSRTYRDFIDKEYVVTGKPLNTAINVLAAYEKRERPNTISSQYAENLYAIARANNTLFTDSFSTAAQAKALFDKMNDLRLQYSVGQAICYCDATFKSLLKDYIATARRWSNDGKISYDVDSIDDVIIKVVPSKWMKSAYVKTSGYVADDDAVQMHAILVDIDTIISPFLLDDIYLDEPTALSDGKSFIASKYAFDLFVHPEAEDFGVIVLADAVEFTVSFAAGTGGSGTMAAVTKDEGSTYTLPASTFTPPSEKEFDKWSVVVGTADAVLKSAGETITVTADTTCTATWKNAG